MDRVRRLSELILERHPEAFGGDYEKNKQALQELAFIPSKHLRNHMAGYLAKVLRGDDEEEEDQPKAE